MKQMCVSVFRLSYPTLTFWFFFTLQAFIYYRVIFSKAWWNLARSSLSSLSTRLRMKVYNHDDEQKPFLSAGGFIHVKNFPRVTGYIRDSSLLSTSCMDFTLGTWPDILTKSIKHSMKGLKKEYKSINNTSQYLQSFVLISLRSQLLSFHKIRGKQSNAAWCI